MADEPKQETYKEIQRDLLRTAIKQPLLDMIFDPNNKDQEIPVIFEANDDYYLGKETAVKKVTDLVWAKAELKLPSIGSAQNPYYKADLKPQQILDIVDQDDNDANNELSAEKRGRKPPCRLAQLSPRTWAAIWQSGASGTTTRSTR